MIEALLEMLMKIPGHTFLWYFASLSIVCIVIGWLWKNADGSTQYLLPELTRFDPIAIAALRGGTNAAVRTAVFRLWDKKLVDFRDDGKDTEIFALRNGEGIKLEPIENEIYSSVEGSRKTSELFADKDLEWRIEAHLAPIYTEMEALHLARTENDRGKVWRIFTQLALVIAGIGGTKLYLGITHSKPVGFLILLLAGSLIALYAALSPNARPTALGQRYLKALELHFGWLRETIKESRTPEGIDPSFAIAIFGLGILGTSALYDPFNKAFAAGKSGGGCGGGCSGGGGCGGGCGGCGGCGG